MDNDILIQTTLDPGKSLHAEMRTAPELPPLNVYYQNLTQFLMIAMIISGFAFLFTLTGYIRFIWIALKMPSKYKSHVISICSLYPIVSFAALMSILFPRMAAIGDTAMQITFTICAYRFYNLCFLYVDGHKQFLKLTETQKFTIQTPPCCCFCRCLQPVTVTKERLSITRFMVIQMPVFQSILMITLNIAYVEQMKMYQNVHLYLGPFIAGSILIGMWGLQIITRAITPEVPEQKLRIKFVCLQLVIICCKFQSTILAVCLGYMNLNVHYPVTPLIQKNVIINLIVIIEVLILSILANIVYERTTTDQKPEATSG